MNYNILYISCSKTVKISEEKKSSKVISNPSQYFLIAIIQTSLRRLSGMLYAVEGVTPEMFASSLIVISLLLHVSV